MTQAESGLLEWLNKGYHGQMNYMVKRGTRHGPSTCSGTLWKSSTPSFAGIQFRRIGYYSYSSLQNRHKHQRRHLRCTSVVQRA